HGLRAVVIERRVLGVAIHEALRAERLPDDREVDLLPLQRLQVVGAAADDVGDPELAIVDAVLLDRGRETQPRDRPRDDHDPPGPEFLPVAYVLPPAHPP